MDWDDLKIVLSVARTGSVTASARQLALAQPTVSRRLRAFEASIGTLLFERAPTGLRPTPLCLQIVADIDRMEDASFAVARHVQARDEKIAGSLRVTSLDWLGDHVVAPMLARFAAANPGVAVDLVSEGRMVSLMKREADIAVRFAGFAHDDLVERRLGTVGYGLYAAPLYLAKFGPPDFAKGCAGHQITMLQEELGLAPQEAWLSRVAPEATVVLRSNGLRAHLAVVEAGLAMAVLPRIVGDRGDGLERITTPVPEPEQAVRLGVHPDLRATPRVRAAIDWLASEFGAVKDALNPREP